MNTTDIAAAGGIWFAAAVILAAAIHHAKRRTYREINRLEKQINNPAVRAMYLDQPGKEGQP